MKAQSFSGLPEILLIEPSVYHDDRGFFLETYQSERYIDSGIPEFVQDNLSCSRKNVLRGLHFQHPKGQGKLVWVPHGRVFDVAVDVRIGSPTFGRWTGRALSSEAHQLYIPPGFAHGFVVLSDEALFAYKCTDYYDGASDRTLLWRDPSIGIEWPVTDPVLSAKDRAGLTLAELAEHGNLPTYGG